MARWATNNEATSKWQKLVDIREKAKDKTKSAFHLDSSADDTIEPPHEAGFEELNASPAFNPTKFLNRQRIGQAGLPAKAVCAVQSTVDSIVHPKTAIKAAATKKTAGTLAKSRPYLSRKADLDFLEAHDDLERAEGSRDGVGDEAEVAQRDGNIDQCKEHIAEMERARLNMRVAWMTSRHVQRVQVVDAVSTPPFPEDSFFEQQDDRGGLRSSIGANGLHMQVNKTKQVTIYRRWTEIIRRLSQFYGAIYRRFRRTFFRYRYPSQTYREVHYSQRAIADFSFRHSVHLQMGRSGTDWEVDCVIYLSLVHITPDDVFHKCLPLPTKMKS
jgi:hypothetical protein